MSERLHYIDWLRVLAVLLLFPFHTGRVFNFGDPFYIKASALSVPLSYTLAFIDRWHMPLLFLLRVWVHLRGVLRRTPLSWQRTPE